jgi:hypothetical protein
MRYSNKKTSYKSNPPKKKLKPIYVDSKEDPRYKAYSDSTALHDYYKLQESVEGNKPNSRAYKAMVENEGRSSGGFYKKEKNKSMTDTALDFFSGNTNKWGKAGEFKDNDDIKEYFKRKDVREEYKITPSDDKLREKAIEMNEDSDGRIRISNKFSSPDVLHEKYKPTNTYRGVGNNSKWKKPEQEVIIKEKSVEKTSKKTPVKKTKTPPIARDYAAEKAKAAAKEARKTEEARKNRLRDSIKNKKEAAAAKDKKTRIDRHAAYDASRSSNTPVPYNQVKASGGKNRQDWIRAKKKK